MPTLNSRPQFVPSHSLRAEFLPALLWFPFGFGLLGSGFRVSGVGCLVPDLNPKPSPLDAGVQCWKRCHGTASQRSRCAVNSVDKEVPLMLRVLHPLGLKGQEAPNP